MKKNLLKLLLLGIFVTNISAFGSQKNKQLVIGFSSKTNSDTFVKGIADAAQARAQEKGVKLIMLDAQGDINKQISDVETLIVQEVDAIIVIPQDIEGSSPVVSMANEANIPIIICNGDVSDKNYTAYVGARDQESGEILGTWFNNNLEKGSKIAILEGPIGQSGQVGRYEGFKQVGMLDNFKVVSIQTANWKRDEAMSIAEDWLTTYDGELKAIVSENDDMAMGALAAIKSSKRKNILIGGVDGLPDAIQAVKSGEMGISVLQDSIGQGKGSVDVALRIINKENYNLDTRIPYIGITSENVEAYIKGGIDAISK
ncbi:MAG: substrate-binding domain-containing protein [Fusobacteriaceae bacterium]